MSIARHLDTLGVYGAMATRVTPVDGEPEDLMCEGGGLEAAFERLGRRPLLAVLMDASVQAILLGDGALTVEVERVAGGRGGASGRFQVRYGDTVVVDEVVEVPPPVAAEVGPVFRPDPASEIVDVRAALHDPSRPMHAVADVGGAVRWYGAGLHGRGAGELPLRGVIPGVDPSSFGAATFRAAHQVKWAYAAGEMAGGIASVDLVVAMAKADLMGFFGAGGLPVEHVERDLRRIVAEVPPGRSWGINLLHNPNEPEVEERTVDLYLRHGATRVSASAYMELSSAVVRYRASGMSERPDGSIAAKNRVIAKVSRPEVAERFLRPPPEGMLRELVASKAITAEQARMAARLPVADDLTAEADSGGHTDRRPLVVLLPILQRLRDRVSVEENYDRMGVRPHIGAAGGLGTPAAVWAVFAMGADYVLTGSVNQASPEAGTSPAAKEMLLEATYTDVASGPAPDMFELGANVQVLSRGTMYAQRAQRLYEIYKACDSLEAIPVADRQRIEKQVFRRPLDEVWAETRAYWLQRDPREIARCEAEPRHKMALTFRWYLGMTSRWARIGDDSRRRDYQIWCGPAMGAFNEWAAGTGFATVESRSVVRIAEALMLGAAAHARVAVARSLGIPLPPGVDAVAPR
jgi:trans-AT polyketide synthase/acyltransferase/oxidoreductase domain-containing protein